ncbi:MAG: hypothetical protein K2G20_06820, partial [Lachnospiraceae bacterium]|nr:hypothetical protein [Lachnospiraceae bacterium]
ARKRAVASRKLRWKYSQWLLYFLLAFLVSAIAIACVLQPGTLRKYIAGADTAALLLKGYADWYKLLEKTFLLASVLTAVFWLAALIFYIATINSPKYKACKMRFKRRGIPVTELGLVIFLGLFCNFVLSAITADINPREKYELYLEDIAAIEERDLLSVDVYLNQKYIVVGLASHGENYFTPLTVYCVFLVFFFDEVPFFWYSVYVVAGSSEFTPNTQHFYNENQSTEWNAENAAIYRVTYTPNCYLVTSVVEYLRDGIN